MKTITKREKERLSKLKTILMIVLVFGLFLSSIALHQDAKIKQSSYLMPLVDGGTNGKN